MKSYLMMLTCLLIGTPALAGDPALKPTPSGASKPAPRAERRVQPCQGEAPRRMVWPQGTLLWGTSREAPEVETSTVLASVDLGHAQRGGTVLKDLRLERGRLVSASAKPEELIGAVLQGTASGGQPVEVALCGAEAAPEDPGMVWHRIEVWNAKKAAWENPCIATQRVPQPRALAVQGIWDGSGARREVAGKFTFACENGALAKCIGWGYKPWQSKDGRSLADLHQACTRMARADYCGDGRSHTREDNPIDMYDDLGVLTRTTEASAGWAPERASFEAAWGPDGALCVARTRDGRSVESVLAECPGRFGAGAEDLGEGDRCTVRRQGARSAGVLLKNRSYGR
jgi:hypothetical protein